jgi:urease accessory protein UreF
MIETTMARPLLAVLRVSDSLFPIGGFGYSGGLEAATAAGLVENASRPRSWGGWTVPSVA